MAFLHFNEWRRIHILNYRVSKSFNEKRITHVKQYANYKRRAELCTIPGHDRPRRLYFFRVGLGVGQTRDKHAMKD